MGKKRQSNREYSESERRGAVDLAGEVGSTVAFEGARHPGGDPDVLKGCGTVRALQSHDNILVALDGDAAAD